MKLKDFACFIHRIVLRILWQKLFGIILLLGGIGFHLQVLSQDIAKIEYSRTSEQQALYDEYCIDIESVNSSLSKVDIMRRMCMCGYLRDAIKPQTELHSITSIERSNRDAKSTAVPTIECINYKAKTDDQSYPCENIHLHGFLNLNDLKAAYGQTFYSFSDATNDVWGWYDNNGNEIALIGTYRGLSFVDITTPNKPKYLGTLEPPSNGGNSFWRCSKVYKNYVYTVTEKGRMQYMDMDILVNLRNNNSIPDSGLLFKKYASEFGSDISNTHTIAINEESGYAYLLGSNLCSGGLYIVNITIPSQPTYAGCYDKDGYTHDAQCVIYKGQDQRYFGREVCIACNEDTVTIVDVTSKTNPIMISKIGYVGSRYTHQGWLDENHDYFVFGDEYDETYAFLNTLKTKTLVLKVTNLTNPVIVGSHIAPDTRATDHNQYIIGQYTYQANYRAGLRILQMNSFEPVNFTEVGYFDIYPSDDTKRLNGAWSVYPFFPSGTIVVSGIEQGLFVLKAGELKRTTTTSSKCSISYACRTLIDWINPFRQPSGYRIHRKSIFGNWCTSRCVSDISVDGRKNRGWECGDCPSK